VIVYGGDYEHTLDVSSIRDGIELRYQVTPRNELFAKVLEAQEFDVCEFSLSNYMMMRARGADWLTAIPIFPSRGFRHSTFLVRKDDSAAQFSDLVGKRIGIDDYTMTAGVWGRGIVAEFHRLHWSQVEWFSSPRQRFAPPPAARVKIIDEDLEDALAGGRLDALLFPRTRDSLLPPSERRFRPLLKNWREAELEYYRSTGTYPISHTVVIPRAKISSCPSLPGTVIAAYEHSMTRAKQRRVGSTFLPWGDDNWTATMKIFGNDPMPHGSTAANQATVAKLQDYLLEQQLIGALLPYADLFWRA